MKRRLAELLVDPLTGSNLELIEWDASERPLLREDEARARRAGIDRASLSHWIETGVLVSHARRVYYPIVGGVPRMLPFPAMLTRTFAARFRARLDRELPGYTLPDGSSMPGEEEVVRNFSSDWLNFDWTGESYHDLTADDMYRAMRFMLDLPCQPVADKLVLDVGVGIGRIADAIARREECELVGIDLSYTVDPANRHFGMNPFFHLVQASAFAPPFRMSTFDLVFSHGVIHHTSSPKAAFERIARLPRPGGRLYVWVRSPVGERSSLGRRVAMGLEYALRPVCSRLPENLQTAVLLPLIGAYLVHQNLLTERTNGAARYRWREAVHAARDRFTAPFAHRLTEEEVSAWFQDAGYTALRRASQRRNIPSCVPENFLAHTGIDGMRLAVPGKTPVAALHPAEAALSQ